MAVGACYASAVQNAEPVALLQTRLGQGYWGGSKLLGRPFSGSPGRLSGATLRVDRSVDLDLARPIFVSKVGFSRPSYLLLCR